ncbi:helix-turn-helix domain-containing protein [Mucilaginibacter jinjuensis]|uniref:Helix-turn-helix transcriptional regulator n=1 Tax=Mucilaginibacter jinjuensis TaxID=1176721 RepID=A0ABY7TCZ2_9SPHI|nr:helix-turn-helix transcriptional regulator [Mucilaginibacter jinjuensis]WCT14326.1 helix-turn-helix transcriptional regulator [Mucilaginibacter jinjuensis]
MKKAVTPPYRFTSIIELHRTLELPKPLHPLVSVFDNTQVAVNKKQLPTDFLFDFYSISFKKRTKGRTGYGQSYYDFDDGTMTFVAPSQVVATSRDTEYFGISLLFHPDFLRNYPLGKHIKRFGFFAYDSNEALHLSEKEKAIILGLFENIKIELENTIDDFSQDIVISHLETLLNYSNRFYKRQFITRRTANHDLLTQLETILDDYFINERGLTSGLPTVEFLASKINLSPRYLSDLLRSITGQSAQQHIHEKLIEKAKEYLSATNLTVAEIAFKLGFEYPQSFNKLFKNKTSLTPVAFKEKPSMN